MQDESVLQATPPSLPTIPLSPLSNDDDEDKEEGKDGELLPPGTTSVHQVNLEDIRGQTEEVTAESAVELNLGTSGNITTAREQECRVTLQLDYNDSTPLQDETGVQTTSLSLPFPLLPPPSNDDDEDKVEEKQEENSELLAATSTSVSYVNLEDIWGDMQQVTDKPAGAMIPGTFGNLTLEEQKCWGTPLPGHSGPTPLHDETVPQATSPSFPSTLLSSLFNDDDDEDEEEEKKEDEHGKVCDPLPATTTSVHHESLKDIWSDTVEQTTGPAGPMHTGTFGHLSIDEVKCWGTPLLGYNNYQQPTTTSLEDIWGDRDVRGEDTAGPANEVPLATFGNLTAEEHKCWGTTQLDHNGSPPTISSAVHHVNVEDIWSDSREETTGQTGGVSLGTSGNLTSGEEKCWGTSHEEYNDLFNLPPPPTEAYFDHTWQEPMHGNVYETENSYPQSNFSTQSSASWAKTRSYGCFSSDSYQQADVTYNNHFYAGAMPEPNQFGYHYDHPHVSSTNCYSARAGAEQNKFSHCYPEYCHLPDTASGYTTRAATEPHNSSHCEGTSAGHTKYYGIYCAKAGSQYDYSSRHSEHFYPQAASEYTDHTTWNNPESYSFSHHYTEYSHPPPSVGSGYYYSNHYSSWVETEPHHFSSQNNSEYHHSQTTSSFTSSTTHHFTPHPNTEYCGQEHPQPDRKFFGGQYYGNLSDSGADQYCHDAPTFTKTEYRDGHDVRTVAVFSPYIHHHLPSGQHMYWRYVEGTMLATFITELETILWK